MSPALTNYRISVARLIVSTYGDKFNHRQFPQPHVLAKALPNGQAIQKCLDTCRLTWSGDFANAEMALKKAQEDISTQLTEQLEGTYELLDNEVAYLPIYSENGTKIGHDTISVLLADDSEIFYTGPTAPRTPTIAGFAVACVGVIS